MVFIPVTFTPNNIYAAQFMVSLEPALLHLEGIVDWQPLAQLKRQRLDTVAWFDMAHGLIGRGINFSLVVLWALCLPFSLFSSSKTHTRHIDLNSQP